MPTSHHSYLNQQNTLRDSWNSQRVDSNIGRLLSNLRSSPDASQLGTPSDHSMLSQPDPRLLWNTSGRMRQLYQEPDLKLEVLGRNPTIISIGRKLEVWRRPGSSTLSTLVYTCVASMPSEGSPWSTLYLSPWFEELTCIGVQLGQGSLEQPGAKPDLTLTLRIRALSSGMDTEVIN